jgi:hypothetical protein
MELDQTVGMPPLIDHVEAGGLHRHGRHRGIPGYLCQDTEIINESGDIVTRYSWTKRPRVLAVDLRPPAVIALVRMDDTTTDNASTTAPATPPTVTDLAIRERFDAVRLKLLQQIEHDIDQGVAQRGGARSRRRSRAFFRWRSRSEDRRGGRARPGRFPR